MKCMSNELVAILPQKLRGFISKDMMPNLREVRLHIGSKPILVFDDGLRRLEGTVTPEDLAYTINAASRYSPWSAATAAAGYLTAPGGHRIGICGEAVMDKETVRGIRTPTSLCIRVAKEVSGIGHGVDLRDSVLILGPPGSGKTTLLRDLVRRISTENRGSISVVDERGEVFPLVAGRSCFDCGDRTDILTGCPKSDGIEMVLRSMGPSWIAVDEITAQRDCEAMMRAGWCGVKLLATVHASSVDDLLRRQIYRPLLQTQLFTYVIVMGVNNRFHAERVVL